MSGRTRMKTPQGWRVNVVFENLTREREQVNMMQIFEWFRKDLGWILKWTPGLSEQCDYDGPHESLCVRVSNLPRSITVEKINQEHIHGVQYKAKSGAYYKVVGYSDEQLEQVIKRIEME